MDAFCAVIGLVAGHDDNDDGDDDDSGGRVSAVGDRPRIRESTRILTMLSRLNSFRFASASIALGHAHGVGAGRSGRAGGRTRICSFGNCHDFWVCVSKE